MYQVLGSPNSRAFRIIWALEEMGLEYELLPYKPHDPDVLKLTPTGKVPLLRDGNTIIPDSVASIQYLADKHNQLTFKAGTPERGWQDAMTQFAVTEIDAILWTMAKAKFALPKEQRVAEIFPTCQWEFDRAIQWLGTMLSDRAYAAGDQLTIPDIVFAHSFGWGYSMGFKLPEGPVKAYIKRVVERDAYKAARALQKP